MRDHWGLVVILVLYVAVSVLYGAAIPIFESPDANGHYAYIHELTEGHGLPIQGTPSGQRVTGYIASHPPLYYTLCAALTFWNQEDVDRREYVWRNPYHAMGHPGSIANKNRQIHPPAEEFPWRGTPLTMHVARLVSTALGLLAVVATYGIARELFPDRRWLVLGATALTAFNPMFVFTAARVSNDAAIAAFGALTIWGAVRLAVRGLSRRGLVLLGAALGLAALSKLSGVTLGPAVALALLLHALRESPGGLSSPLRALRRGVSSREGLRRLLVDGLFLFGTTALVCGWWFARNLLLYGELMGTHAWLSHTATVRPEPIGFFEVIPQLQGLEMSYWAMFGWFNVPAAPWMYRAWWVLVRLAVVGLALILVDQWTARRFSRPVQAGLIVVAFAFLLVFGSVWRFIMIVLGAQGRYLLPTLAAISVLLMLGLSRLVPRRWAPALTALLAGGQLALVLICLEVFILPVYAKPDIVPERELPEDMVRFDMTFKGTSIQLLGGHIEAEEGAHPGQGLPVSLYWRALEPTEEDLFVFIKILGRGMEPLTGVDCYPGGGNFPPALWQPGVIYRDRYVLPLAADAEVPTIAALHAGLHRLDGPPIEARTADGGSAVLKLLDLVALRPPRPLSDEVTHPVGARLGEAIRLVGYDLSGEGVRPGESLTVTLVWRAEGRPADDYTVFVHLIDEQGDLVAQDDHQPLDGEYRTSFWFAGDVVRDTHHLTLADDLPPCACTIQIGMYDPAVNVRLPAYDALGGHFEGEAIVAGEVRIR